MYNVPIYGTQLEGTKIISSLVSRSPGAIVSLGHPSLILGLIIHFINDFNYFIP